MIFHWSLCDSKSPQTWILLTILANFNSAVVWILNSFTDLQFTQSIFKVLDDYSKCSNYNWYHYNLFQLSGMVQVFVEFSPFFFFSLLEEPNPLNDTFFSSLKLRLVFCLGLGDPLISQSPREFYRSHFLEQIMICTYTIC